jgi:DNA primase
VLLPDPGLTDADLGAYDEKVADVALPQLAGRLLVLHRVPDGSRSGFTERRGHRGC